MKKLFLLLFLTFVISGCNLSKVNTASPSPTSAPVVKSTVVLDFGGGKITTYSGVLGKTALDGLTNIAVENNITMDVKKYSFGMLVNAIGGRENSKDLSWIYYVNGKSPDVGADKYELKNGDVIEWKYIKPSF